ncbi:MAG: hypothetical protein H6834_13860, partial [Planctomycetes bacterium]|nr:hypothetical protein [Planctomycetota bacterium]
MRIALLALSSLVVVSSGVCSQTLEFASPRGIEFFEGNSSSNIMLGNYSADTRVQQVDNSLVGLPLPAIRYLAWRRDGLGTGSANKTVTLEIVMAHSDFATVSNTWASNYKDTPRTVFTKKAVSLPDWTTASSKTPQEFDFQVKLDSPFIYNRTDAIVWDVINSNNALNAMPQDWQSTNIAHTYGDYPSDLGGGCATKNGAMRSDTAFRADATNIELGVKVTNGPSAAPIVLLVGASDPNIQLPNACGVLHVNPILL